MSTPPKWTPVNVPKEDPVPLQMNPEPTGTPSPVIVPAQPASYAVPWSDSIKFKSYVSAEVLLVIGWFIENLSTHQGRGPWTWIAVTVSSLTLAAAAVRDWASPAIIAPFAALNTNNLPPKP